MILGLHTYFICLSGLFEYYMYKRRNACFNDFSHVFRYSYGKGTYEND